MVPGTAGHRQPGSLSQVDSYSKHIFSLITFHVYTVNGHTAVDLCWVLVDTFIYYTKGYCRKTGITVYCALKILCFHWL